MKVRELIELLKKVDQEKEVKYYSWHEIQYISISKVAEEREIVTIEE